MNTIERTKKYDVFSHGDEQREMKRGHVTQLKKSMKIYGFLASKPVSVYIDDQGRHVVIDGHHRLEAAKSIGIPVVYMVVKESEKNSMMKQNELMLKWNFNNFCQAWAAKGRADYIRLIAYSSIIPIRMAASMLYGYSSHGGDSLSNAIKDGTFEIRTTRVIDALLSLIAHIGETDEVVTSRAFAACFSKAMLVDEFSPTQLRLRIEANPKWLKKVSKDDMMMEQIESLYNFKSKVKIPLAHLAREASAARCANS